MNIIKVFSVIFLVAAALALFLGGPQAARADTINFGFGTDGQDSDGWTCPGAPQGGVGGYDGGPAGYVSGANNDFYVDSTHTIYATGSAALGSDKLVAGTYSINLYGIGLADANPDVGNYWSPPNPATEYLTINALSVAGQALLGTSTTLMTRTANEFDVPSGANSWDYYTGILQFTVPANSPAIGDYLELKFTPSGYTGASYGYGGESWVAFTDINGTVTPIPEPATAILLLVGGLGLVGLGLRRLLRRRHA